MCWPILGVSPYPSRWCSCVFLWLWTCELFWWIGVRVIVSVYFDLVTISILLNCSYLVSRSSRTMEDFGQPGDIYLVFPVLHLLDLQKYP